jgi:hypothetical protein
MKHLLKKSLIISALSSLTLTSAFAMKEEDIGNNTNQPIVGAKPTINQAVDDLKMETLSKNYLKATAASRLLAEIYTQGLYGVSKDSKMAEVFKKRAESNLEACKSIHGVPNHICEAQTLKFMNEFKENIQK